MKTDNVLVNREKYEKAMQLVDACSNVLRHEVAKEVLDMPDAVDSEKDVEYLAKKLIHVDENHVAASWADFSQAAINALQYKGGE